MIIMNICILPCKTWSHIPLFFTNHYGMTYCISQVVQRVCLSFGLCCSFCLQSSSC